MASNRHLGRIIALQTLYEYVDLLAHLKFNQLQLYTEHSFAYPGHEVVWKNASPVTPDEISRGEKICENANSKLAWFETNFFEIEVTCKSGATFIIETDSSVQFDTKVEAEPKHKQR